MGRLWWRARGLSRKLASPARAAAPVALHFASIVVGWALLAQGVVAWTGRPDIVWPFAGGLFLLSVAGWGHMRVIAAAGVYALSRRKAA